MNCKITHPCFDDYSCFYVKINAAIIHNILKYEFINNFKNLTHVFESEQRLNCVWSIECICLKRKKKSVG